MTPESKANATTDSDMKYVYTGLVGEVRFGFVVVVFLTAGTTRICSDNCRRCQESDFFLDRDTIYR